MRLTGSQAASAVALLLFLGLVHATDELGLFVEVRWRNASWSDACNAPTCAREGCVARYNFFIEGACYKHKSSVTTTSGQCDVKVGLAERYAPSDDGTICKSTGCGGEGREDVCGGTDAERLAAGACASGVPWRTDFLYLPDFCRETSSPDGAFAVPMLESRTYGNASDCEEASGAHRNGHYPADPHLCLARGVSQKDAGGERLIMGGSRHYCDAEGRRVSRWYSDPLCVEQDAALNTPSSVMDACQAPDLVPGLSECASRARIWFDCGDIRYHCKDLSAEFDFATKLAREDETVGDAPSNANGDGTNDTDNGSDDAPPDDRTDQSTGDAASAFDMGLGLMVSGLAFVFLGEL